MSSEENKGRFLVMAVAAIIASGILSEKFFRKCMTSFLISCVRPMIKQSCRKEDKIK